VFIQTKDWPGKNDDLENRKWGDKSFESWKKKTYESLCLSWNTGLAINYCCVEIDIEARRKAKQQGAWMS